MLKDHIPGNPTIIVQNMPGASGVKTANYMATQAPRDGTVIAATHSSIITAALTSPGAASFDATKFSWIGSATSDPYLGYVWHTSRIMTLADARTTEVIMGGVSVGSAGVDLAILARDMFGLKIKIVTGYKSSNVVKLAMERGEVDGTFANAWSSLQGADPEWLTAGKVRIIVQHGFRKHPALPDVPLDLLLREDRERPPGAGLHAGAPGGGQALFCAARDSAGAARHPAPRLRRDGARSEILRLGAEGRRHRSKVR